MKFCVEFNKYTGQQLFYQLYIKNKNIPENMISQIFSEDNDYIKNAVKRSIWRFSKKRRDIFIATWKNCILTANESLNAYYEKK